jgi:formate/nitrite transporter
VSFGVNRLLGGLTFSLGLILVVVAGAELFTGNNLIVMAWASRRITLRDVLRNWVVVYVANLMGASGIAVLVFASGHYKSGNGAVAVRALDIGSAKTSLTILEALLLGVLANILVCLAVWLCYGARSVADKVLAIVFPITAFVAAGFEHSVANAYFVPEALLIKDRASPRYLDGIGVRGASYPNLTWQRFITHNLLPVTIGNLIGGALLVGLVYWFVYLRPTSRQEPPGR